MKFFIFLAVLFLSSSFPAGVKAGGGDAFRTTDFPLPRFVSLNADKVYVRAGPGLQYPIKWQFQKENLPVEVILEFDAWRKIRDYEGQVGWVHVSLLSGKRYALIVGDGGVLLRKKTNEGSKVVAELEPRVVARIKQCEIDWCELSVSGYTGWAYKNFLWGVYDSEDFD